MHCRPIWLSNLYRLRLHCLFRSPYIQAFVRLHTKLSYGYVAVVDKSSCGFNRWYRALECAVAEHLLCNDCVIDFNHFTTSTWQLRITSSAALCFSSVSPAHKSLCTIICASLNAPIIASTFDTTQMSVQVPQNSITSGFSQIV